MKVMITSRLTTRARTTIPAPVRRALRLQPGDQIVYRIEGERVLLSAAVAAASIDPFAIFDEWDTPADRDGYAGL
jgi:antitoxin PrlF